VLGIPTQSQSNGGYAIGWSDVARWASAAAGAPFTVATPNYFKTIGVPIRRGRDWRDRRRRRPPLTAIATRLRAPLVPRPGSTVIIMTGS
jgi:hypothetical protein